jgi:hypothetical protein
VLFRSMWMICTLIWAKLLNDKHKLAGAVVVAMDTFFLLHVDQETSQID